MLSPLTQVAADHARRVYDRTQFPNYRCDSFFADHIQGYCHLGLRAHNLEMKYYLIVAIAGTNDFGDWAANLSCVKNYHGIHYGWWGAAHKIKPQIDSILKKYQLDIPILLTGHSAGGAIAGILARFYSKTSPTDLITFGCPKWGNRKVCDRLDKQLNSHIRYAHPFDCVPLLPPHGYQQCGKLVEPFWWGNPHSVISYQLSVINEKIKS